MKAHLPTTTILHSPPGTFNHSLNLVAKTAAATFLIGPLVVVVLLSATDEDRSRKHEAVEYTMSINPGDEAAAAGCMGIPPGNRNTIFKLWLPNALASHPKRTGVFNTSNQLIQ